jgi:hypothetical protein
MKYILPYISVLLFFASCRTVKQASTTRVNTDSVVTHVKDSMSRVFETEITNLNRMIEEMTSSGVTFTVDSCPEREAAMALLDSAGKERYKAILLEEKVKSLSNKVTISERGVITAEGNIREARFSAYRIEQELQRVEKTNDSLHRVIESDSARYTKSVAVVERVVKRTVFPWWFWLLLPACGAIGWVAKRKLS